MLAYAAGAPRFAERRSSPNAMLAIIAGHVALVAVVMSAKMDLPLPFKTRPIEVTWIEPIEPPPPNLLANPAPRPQPGPSVTDPRMPLPPLPGPDLSRDPVITDPAPLPLPTPLPPNPAPTPRAVPIHIGAQLVTPPSDLKPPYPASKLLAEEEAVLRLSLTIDERGRVISVEPVGRADPAFLAAARRHLLAHWRYKPASEDGRSVSSTTVITLRFQLDG
jgi:protein TonB